MDSGSSHGTTLSRMFDSGANLTVDGALATELEARGCDLDDPLWSAKVLWEQPQLIKQVQRDYFDAGAEIAITSSYQALPQGFARRGIAEAEALELVALSVRLADEARSEYLTEDPDAGPLLIAGAVGPYGAYLADGSEYRGDYVLTQREFKEFHRPRIGALVEEFDVESWFSCTLRDGGHISDGTPFTEVAALCGAQPRVVAIGVNCVPPNLVSPALGALRNATDKPLLAYPNSGPASLAGAAGRRRGILLPWQGCR